MFSKRPATIPVKSDPSIRRNAFSPDLLVSLPAGESVKTVGDIFAYTAQKYGDKVACSYRDVVDIVQEPKMVRKPDGSEEEKMWKYFTLSPPKPVTHRELDARISSLVSGLLSLGFTTTSTPIASRPRASIYADTCLNWQLFAQSCARLGSTITTAYTTLGEEGLLTSLVEPDVELVFCGEEQLGLVAKVIGRAERVKWVVYDASKRLDKGLIDTIRSTVESRHGRLVSISELEQLGTQNPVQREDLGPKPTPEDLFCIMYTSGSTGAPKGVLLSHGNVVASLAGSVALWGKYAYPKTDLLMAYLPLAHILEQFLEYTFYLLGVQVGYASVKTLLDDSVRNCQGDFAAFKPTMIGGVPAIYEMIRKGMMKKIAEAGPVVGGIFGLAVKGKQTLPWPLSSVIDKVLFARVKQATGGRLRVSVCGGGALSKDTQLFLSTVLAPMMIGYGMTETCGMASITTPEHWSIGSAGVLGPSCEAKLIDQPDLGYSVSHHPPQGEIWLRGPNIFKGYFKRDDLNAESFEDGWFKTGDIGQWDTDGTLRIIDRVKNLIKLQNGEYLALDRVESIYKTCNVVMMLCICAPPQADRPIAIVYPHEGNLLVQLKAAGISVDGGPPQWTNNKQIKDFIKTSLMSSAKQGGLVRAELIKDVVLTPEEWTPDNGMLTPAMKLARPQIAQKYAKEIEAAYTK
ncbi:hypothetical protein BD324DRAFT_637764 [Kockovaella imperatae]|uniref:AMP-dependent synthetase/ligase domain-containing protein n=1 Tax=Kockovaella imperatae TaxID=4999 RepID=A0A1Y1UA34_9TREE|nr:hypothetical protein BD324DRAFT_637764 [Kockovaella imperatae]ORX33945.1 hypothetical protein BD324DRAFT_637764 [Kockovaella imperatae]